MKTFTKLLIGLALSGAQISAAPLEARQSSITSVNAAANRLLSRLLTEAYNLNTALTTLTTLPNLPTSLSLTTVQNDINAISTNLGSVSALLSSANVTAGPATGCGLSVTDVVAVLGNLGTAQSLVGELEGTLGGLTSGQTNSLTSPLATLEMAINSFNEDLQSYTGSLVPCISEVAPTLLTPVEAALAGVGNAVSSLLGGLGLGGVASGAVGSIP